MISNLALTAHAVLHAMAEDWLTTGLMLWNFAMTVLVCMRTQALQMAVMVIIVLICLGRETRNILEHATRQDELLRIHQQFHALEERLQQQLFYDGTGLRDFASIMSGGRVVPELTSETCAIEHPEKAPWYKRWARDASGSDALTGLPPEFAIYPDTHVGSCWPMKGRSGSLGISLAHPTSVTSFTVDHVPQRMAFRFESAPRNGELWGLLDGALADLGADRNLTVTDAPSLLLSRAPQVRSSRYAHSSLVLLGSFDFNIHSGRPFQTYNVSREVLERLGETRFGVVVFFIRENWGDDDLTCLYRVRVHSDETV